jgi:hypothetical protein
MFLSKYSLDRNNTIDSLFRTSDFFIAEYYDLRNTIFGGLRISPQVSIEILASSWF